MAVLNFLKFDSKFSKPGVGNDISSTLANSRLAILENNLRKKSGGFLSSADYQKLIEEAAKLQDSTNQNTKAGQNLYATLDTKISNYQSKIDELSFDQSENTNIKSKLEDDLDAMKLSYAGDPKKYLEESVKKINEVKDQVGQLYGNANDANNIKVANDYLATYKELEDRSMVMESLKNNPDKMAAFVTTDANGRAINVEYKMLTPANQSGGYMETNKKIDGVPIWLMPSGDTNGQKIGVLNGKIFKETNFTAALGTAPRILTAADPGEIKSEDLQIRQYIPDKEWVQGKYGLYKNVGDNKYVRYGNINPQDLGLSPSQIQPVNRVWESRIAANVIQDGMSTLDTGSTDIYSKPAIDSYPLKPEAQAAIQAQQSAQSRFKSTQTKEQAQPKEEKTGFFDKIRRMFTGNFKKKENNPTATSGPGSSSFLDTLNQ